MKELLKKLREAKAKLEQAKKDLETARKDKMADEVVTQKQAEYDTAKAALDAVCAEVEAAKKAADEAKRIADAEKAAVELAEVVVPEGGGLAATAKDHEAEDRQACSAFMRYVGRGTKFLTTAEVELLAPRSPKFKEAQGGMSMPRSLVGKILGPVFLNGTLPMRSKAIPMTSAVAADGGFLVPQDFRRTLLELPAEAPSLLPRCTVLPSPTGTITIPRLAQTDANEYGGVVVRWTAEAGTKQETQPRFEQVTIAAHEVSGYTEISHRLLSRSALDLEALVSRLFRDAIYDAIDNALLTGTGVGQPMGIVGTAGIRAVVRAAAGRVGWADLVNLKYAVRPYHRMNGIFVVEDTVLNGLELATDGFGRPLFTPSVANGVFDRLCGKPYIGTTRLPNLGNSGDVLFGDPGEVYVGMEEEVVVRRSDDYQFQNNVAAFAVFAVVGGQLVQPRVWAILEGES